MRLLHDFAVHSRSVQSLEDAGKMKNMQAELFQHLKNRQK